MIAILASVVLFAQVDAPYAPVPPPKAWHWVDYQGEELQVWGFESAGRIVWWPGEQPTRPNRRPRPAPEPPDVKPNPKPITPRNFGVDVAKLNHDKYTIRASDPETLRQFEQAAKDADECPILPGPVRRAEQDVQTLAYYAVAGVLLVVGILLVATGRRRNP